MIDQILTVNLIEFCNNNTKYFRIQFNFIRLFVDWQFFLMLTKRVIFEEKFSYNKQILFCKEFFFENLPMKRKILENYCLMF